MNIACCTHDQLLSSDLEDLLSRHGYACESFRDETSLTRALRHRGGIDLVLIDVGFDPQSVDNLLSWLHCRVGESAPVILLSTRWGSCEIASALDAGADDCVARPFDKTELVARVKALLRRRGVAGADRTRIEMAGFVLDKNAVTMSDRNSLIELTPREFALAWLLFSNAGNRLSREAISLAIWGTDKEIAGRAIEQHIYKLRKKAGLSPARGVAIRTAYAQGYRLELCEGKTAVVTSHRRSAMPDPGLSLLQVLDAQRAATSLAA